MADFDLTQTDAQVQSILNDAQNAQGAGAQTTLTTDYIMLKDTSGNYHKILKDSFTEACRNVLAGLLVNNDKGTTISQIPAIASGDFGSVTPANLASVLGAFSKNNTFDVDIIHQTSTYVCHSQYLSGTLPSSHSVAAFATLETFAVSDAIQTQRLTYYSSGFSYIFTRLWRNSTEWGDWQQV
jgi:hypothetical protein